MKVLEEFKEGLRKLYRKKLKKIILYGSWARGEANENSDIDIAIVLDGKINPSKEIERMISLITELNLKYDVLISVYPVSLKDYMKVKSPLLMNIKKEGKEI